MAQLDDVYSDLRLNYETPKGLISLASLSVAKPTLFETLGWHQCFALRLVWGFLRGLESGYWQSAP